MSDILLVLTMVIGAACGGTFGVHPYFPKGEVYVS
jgi:hypothetical protein